MRSRRTFLAAFAFALVACRGILGIDEDKPILGDTADGSDPNDSASSDGTTSDGGPGADANDLDVALGDVDRRYAQWPLPPPSPPLSQYDITTDIVTDKLTGLVWQRTSPVDSKTWAESVAYCDALSLGGADDWRLPTRIELFTTFDFGRSLGPAANPSVFDVSGSGLTVWTSSHSLLNKSTNEIYELLYDLQRQNVLTTSASNAVGVRCVRGGPDKGPIERFIVSQGAALDLRTKVLWQITPASGVKHLLDARAACSALSLGGFATGWRLPTIRELVSLVDEAIDTSPLVPPGFASPLTPKYWTDTALANPADEQWAVDFNRGDFTSTDPTTESYSVRCVH